MKVDFSKVTIWDGVAHRTCVVRDLREEIADAIYKNGAGIAHYALAMKIYNSAGETEIDGKERALLTEFFGKMGTPALIDAMEEALAEEGE